MPLGVKWFENPQGRSSTNDRYTSENYQKSYSTAVKSSTLKTVKFNSNRLTNGVESGKHMSCNCQEIDSNCDFCNHWSLPDNQDSVSKLNTLCSSQCSILTSSSWKYVSNHSEIGPLLNDGAPYSPIGIVELKLLLDEMNLPFPDVLDLKLAVLQDFTKLQYGNADHSSQARNIIGLIVLTMHSDRGCPVDITHIVLEGSSQWIVGKNVTK